MSHSNHQVNTTNGLMLAAAGLAEEFDWCYLFAPLCEVVMLGAIAGAVIGIVLCLFIIRDQIRHQGFWIKMVRVSYVASVGTFVGTFVGSAVSLLIFICIRVIAGPF